jgi:hypothetical protein
MSDPIKYAEPIQNADVLSNLPSDKTQPSHNELHIVDTLFKQHGNGINAMVNESKDAVLVGLLFVIFSLPIVDGLVKRFVTPAQNSPYILVGVKALMVMVAYWLVKHFYLSKKGT